MISIVMLIILRIDEKCSRSFLLLCFMYGRTTTHVQHTHLAVCFEIKENKVTQISIAGNFCQIIMNDNYQEKLLGLTGERASSAIKTYLENLPDTKKGRVFEWYLAELFKGNGWLVKVQGGRYDKGADILLYHPKTPSDVSLIVQAKNWATPLSFDDTKIELIKFEEKGSPKYKCNQFDNYIH